MYETVLKAQTESMSAIKENMNGKDIDEWLLRYHSQQTRVYCKSDWRVIQTDGIHPFKILF